MSKTHKKTAPVAQMMTRGKATQARKTTRSPLVTRTKDLGHEIQQRHEDEHLGPLATCGDSICDAWYRERD